MNGAEGFSKSTAIEKGSTVLGLYSVESDPITGGFGRVFRVYHPGWNVNLAMKQHKNAGSLCPEEKEDFIGECSHWIDLGLHPHIVSCYYVRDIDGVLSIFSEWMEGGSLKDAIEDGRLYEGSGADIRERIINIAIQYARGLGYAHERGMIHQDVKPANLLLDGWTAKAADFGIAKVKGMLAMHEVPEGPAQETRTVLVRGGAYTPLYCSPEQTAPEAGGPLPRDNPEGETVFADERILTRRTDIWSWAVTVLEMYAGGHPWANGVIAGTACDEYLNAAKVPVSEAMRDLLHRCFRENEKERPADFDTVEAELLAIYGAETGRGYCLPKAKAAELSAESLNNRALSFLDLGKPEEAEAGWKAALEKNPSSAVCLYNLNMYLWDRGRTDDAGAVRALTSLSGSPKEPPSETAEYYHCLGRLHISRWDAEAAAECLKKGMALFGETAELKAALSEAEKMAQSGNAKGFVRSFEEAPHGWNRAACFAPGGTQVFSAGGGGIQLWDTETGACTGSIKTHLFPGSSFTGIAAGPGGRIVTVSSIFGPARDTIKIWDPAAKKIVRSIKAGQHLTSLCFSPDGKRLLTGSFKDAKLFDAAAGKCIFNFGGRRQPFGRWWGQYVCFSPGGKQLLIGSGKVFELWDTGTAGHVCVFKGNAGLISCVCFSPGGKHMLAGYRPYFNSQDKAPCPVLLWDIEAGQCIHAFEGHEGSVESLCFCSDGRRFISTGKDLSVKVWDMERKICIRTLFHPDMDTFVSCAPDGRSAVSGSKNGAMLLWSLPDKKAPHSMIVSRIQSSAETSEGIRRFNRAAGEIETLLGLGDIRGALEKTGELKKERRFGSFDRFMNVVNRTAAHCRLHGVANQSVTLFPVKNVLAFSFTGNGCLAALAAGKKTEIRDILKGECVSVLNASPGNPAFMNHYIEYYNSISGIRFSPGGTAVFVRDKKRNRVHAFNAVTGECINGMCFSGSGETAFSPGKKHALLRGGITTKLLDLDSGTAVRTFLTGQPPAPGIVESICFSSDGKQFLYGLYDKIYIRHTETGKCLKKLRVQHAGPFNQIASARFSPDGKRILAVLEKGGLLLLDAAAETCLHLNGEQGAVLSACFSPCGRRILSGSGRRSPFQAHGGKPAVRLWDTAGKCIHTFEGHTSGVSQVYFSPCGTRIASVSKNEVIVRRLEYEMEFPGWHDWDEGAGPYLTIFLALYPAWTDDDFNSILVPDLQNRGYGWLRPEGVRAKLGEILPGPLF